MYATRWSPGLRQGDILKDIPFAIPTSKVSWVYESGVAQRASAATPRALIYAQSRTGMVISHDCEFNERKRPLFIVARVENLNARLTPEQVEQLRLGNDLAKASELGVNVALDTFFLEPRPPFLSQPMRVNFCAVTSLPMEDAANFANLKRVELDQHNRELLRSRLAMFFGRPANDIGDEEKIREPITDPD